MDQDDEPAASTEDGLLNGRLRIRQPRAGYRAGLDAALLAAACDATPGLTVLDLGCGVGGAMLAAAVRRPGVSFIGVERDPAALRLAQENISLNALDDRVGVIAGDVAEPWSRLHHPQVDAALCNPPFFDNPNSLRGPAPQKAGAWLADAGLHGWTGFLLKAVRSSGTITVIHRADRLADLLAALGGKAGSFQILPIHAFAEAPAKRILVRAIKGGKAPLRLLPALVLHDRDGAKHTEQTEAILRGRLQIRWD